MGKSLAPRSDTPRGDSATSELCDLGDGGDGRAEGLVISAISGPDFLISEGMALHSMIGSCIDHIS